MLIFTKSIDLICKIREYIAINYRKGVILLKKYLLKAIGSCSLFITGLAVGVLKVIWFYQPEE